MALNCPSPTAGSSDGSDEVEQPEAFGYGFEPFLTEDQRQERQLARERRRRFNKVLGKLLPDDRLSTSDWCTCGNCSVLGLRLPKECYCCHEVPVNVVVAQYMEQKRSNFTCITENPSFAVHCLDEEILKVVELAVAEKWNTLDQVDFSSSRTFRHAAYVSYTYWVFGPVGREVRKVIPACAVAKIRERFPETDGNYTGYKSASEDEEV